MKQLSHTRSKTQIGGARSKDHADFNDGGNHLFHSSFDRAHINHVDYKSRNILDPDITPNSELIDSMKDLQKSKFDQIINSYCRK